MRKPISAIALLALFSCPTMASFAQVAGTTASSQQSVQGSREASSSAEVSNNRLMEFQPPLSKEAQQMANSSNGNGNAGGGSNGARPAPSAMTGEDEVHAQVQSYVWTK